MGYWGADGVIGHSAWKRGLKRKPEKKAIRSHLGSVR